MAVTGADGVLSITFSEHKKDAIVIRGWSPTKNLGIVNLPGTITPPVTSVAYSGDFTKKTVPGQPTKYLFDAQGNYVFDGILPH